MRVTRCLGVGISSLMVLQLMLHTASATTISSIAGGISKNPTANGGGSYVTTINDRNGAAGTNHSVPSFTRTFSVNVGPWVVDYDLTFTGLGGDLHNFNGPTYSYGNVGGNGAIDQPGEGVQFSVSNVAVASGPSPALASFDGFTALGIFFAQSSDDAGAITDGTTDLWTYDGALGTSPGSNADPAGVKTPGQSSDDSIYDWFGIKAHTHAQVDLSGFLPQTLNYEFRTASVDGSNRNRVNAVGVQFTVIPEPSAMALVLMGSLLAFTDKCRRRSR